MSRSRRRTIRTYLYRLLGGLLLCAAVAGSLEWIGHGALLEKTELLTLDFRYRIRPRQEMRSDIGYVDFDDTSIAFFGRWVWPRSRQVALARLLDRYDARALGYDVFFTEKGDIVLNAERAFDSSVSAVSSGLTAEARAAATFQDHDAEFEAAIRDAGNIYLAQFMVSQNTESTVGNSFATDSTIEQTRLDWPPEKVEAVTIASQYAHDADSASRNAFFKAVDIVPPLARFGMASAGIGYAQIVKDLDQNVRLYPLFMYYDAHIYPSIAIVMLSRMLEVPIEAMRIVPGAFIELPRARVPRAAPYPASGGTPAAALDGWDTATLRIPIDEHGQMLVNWAGGFLERGLHLSYRDLARFAAEDAAREVAHEVASRITPTNPAVMTTAATTLSTTFAAIRAAAAASLKSDGLVANDEAESMAENVAVAWLLARHGEPANHHDPNPGAPVPGSPAPNSDKGNPAGITTPAGTAVPAGATAFTDAADPVAAAASLEAQRAELKLKASPAEILLEARAVALAHRVAAEGDKAAADPELSAAWQSAIRRSVSFFAARGALDDADPLWFPEPISVPWDGVARSFTAVDLENKILMAGLTGVGTIDLNPMPFDNDCPMVALHENALNTILTGSYLSFSNPDTRRLFLWGMALAAGILCALLSPAQAYVACTALVIGFSWHVLSQWIYHGRWLHWVEPILAVTVVYVAEAVVAFVRAVREKQRVRGIFSTMVSPKVLKLMEDNPDRFSLTGERKPATIFFSSIDGFGTVTQREAPEELGSILGLYLTPCSELILEYDGYIDKYEGHVIMADFGVPLDDPDHAWKCCFAAIEQQMDIEAFRDYVLARYGAEVRVFMGINSGYVSAGNMGSEKKMQYTVMGDTVNVSARFRPANGIYNTGIIVGEETAPLIRDHCSLRMLDRLLLKGKTKPTTLYEVMGWKSDMYRQSKVDKPIPDSLLVRWLRCPPHKVYGFRAFWRRRAEERELPMAGKIADFFESQEPQMEEIITGSAIMGIQYLNQELDHLAEHLHRIEGFDVAPASPPGTATSGAATATAPSPAAPALGWKDRLTAWRVSAEYMLAQIEETLKEGGKGIVIPEGVPSLPELRLHALNLLEKITTMTENLGKTPKSWIPAVSLSLTKIRDWLEGAHSPDILAKVQAGWDRYRKAVHIFHAELVAHPANYHELMAIVGSLSDRREHVRDLYEEALRRHWDREWDKALALLDEALELDAEDGPSACLKLRIEGYQENPPGAKWQGEFVQTKK